jgi:hypothetical protein
MGKHQKADNIGFWRQLLYSKNSLAFELGLEPIPSLYTKLFKTVIYNWAQSY